MVTIAASRVWALNTQRRLLWTSHAPIAGGWPSRGCGPGFVSCKGAGYPCLCRDLGFPLVATGGRLLPAVAGLVLRWQWGIPLKQRGLLLLPALRYRWSCLGNGLAPPMEGGYRLYPLALPPTIGCRSLHWRVSQTNPEMMVQYRCHPPGGQRCRIWIRKWWLCLPGPLRVLGSSGHLWVRPSPRLVCSDRPEGRVLPCVDPSAPQAIPAVCVRRTGISVQSPALRAVPVAPCLHESSGGSPCSPERTGRAHSQLPRRLAYTSSVAGPVMRTQGHGALAPQPVGPSGQLGKEQTLPGSEDLFSRLALEPVFPGRLPATPRGYNHLQSSICIWLLSICVTASEPPSGR